MQTKRITPSTIVLLIVVGIALAYILSSFGRAVDVTPRLETGTLDWPVVLNSFEGGLSDPLSLLSAVIVSGSWSQKLTVFGSLVYVMWFLMYITTRKKFRKGEEHGSARWATKKEAKELLDEKGPSNAIILNDDVFLGLNTRKTQLNLNVLVIGGSGSGKSRFFVKPNIMQVNTNYVVTDPKGELLRSTGKMLESQGYTVKVFNLVNMRNSHNYNPFAYLTDENGEYSDANVIKLVNVLMKNTKKEGQSGGDQFWEDSTEALLLALAFYLVYEGEEHEKTFSMMMDLIQLAEAKEDEEDYKSPLDIMFEDLEKEDPYHPAVKYYKIFKKAAGKTAKSILISTAVRLKAFNNKDVANLTSLDTMNIQEIGEKKTALFVVIPDSDDTFNFLVAMLYTQMFDVLYRSADFKHGGRLPIHVRFLLDEFANIGTIPNFDKLIATMRSREISVNPILQNIAQLKKMYKDSWESIVGNCDSLLFLGGKEPGSLDYMAKAIGKETIDTLNRNVSRSHRNSSTSKNEGILGRELMTADEIGRMSKKHCLLLVRGTFPFYSRKFRVNKHSNYKYLDEANPEQNTYDISHIATTVSGNTPLVESIQQTDANTDDDYVEEIHEILSNISKEDEQMLSTIDIPDDELEEEIVVLADNDNEEVTEELARDNNHDPIEFEISDFVLDESDEFSELNFEELMVDDSDQVILDEDD